MRLTRRTFGATVLAGASGLMFGRAHAAMAPVKVGVLTDMNGPLSSVLGLGSVDGARMAIEDFGGSVLGTPVELVFADHQSKPDVGASIARKWLDEDGVDLIIDYGNSAVALACINVVHEKNKITIVTGAASSDISGKFCTPNSFHWGYDTYMQTAPVTAELTAEGNDTWFFITVDYAFGIAMQRDATAKLEAASGKVLGAVRFPLDTSDMSAFLLQAQASGAKAIGIIAAAADLERLMKQGDEFRLWEKQRAAVFGLQMNDVVSIGAAHMQGVVHDSIFYWDLNDRTRDLGERFWKRNGKPPSETHAVNYSAVTQYLKAVRAAGTKETGPVLKALHEMPVDDLVTPGGTVRLDGRLVRPTYLLKVKPAEQVKRKYDVFELVREVPGSEAFRPLALSACPLVKS